jgi:hypothetical protein
MKEVINFLFVSRNWGRGVEGNLLFIYKPFSPYLGVVSITEFKRF